MNRRRTPSNFTYVSSCVKYMIFLLNFAFWLFGGLLIGIGTYAFLDKWRDLSGHVDWHGLVKLDTIYDIVLNISLVLIIAGAVVFVVSFAGCVGALRENTCLLKFYSLCLLIFFLLEMAVAIMGFVFPHTMQSMLEESFTDKIIHTYRDDADLQNLIDFAQQEFRCCGLSSEGYMDWSKNEYFNCSSPSVERCGVPFSCCINATDITSGLVNIMCGYGAQELSVAEASKKVWTSGCIEVVRSWAERNLYTIAGIALGVALSQLFVIYLGKTLEGQIELQKSRWSS
ncbi:tetraspanin-33-like isoform X1 [Lycorma delicatula]|uniref:tetraspanin-33-like isoform X1 n=1 Tax=Lycorma delicatula TaxID=130591 RepID=UPI003F511293